MFRVESASFVDGGGSVEVVAKTASGNAATTRSAIRRSATCSTPSPTSKAEEVVSRGEAEARGHSLASPALEIVLSTEDASQSLALYPAVEGFAAATREGRDVVLLVALESVEEVTSKLEALRNAEPEKEEGDEEDGADE